MLNIETFDINDSSCKGYSIEFSSLIEFIKKLRSLTKIAKFHIIKLLNMKINKLKSKLKVKDADSCSKLKNKQDEVDFLEKADLDTLSKRVFANKYTSNDLEKLGDRLSLDDRIVVRLFSFNKIHQEITNFRSQHSDWEELVDVVLYKTTCGKMKVNKTAKKTSKAVTIPLAYGIQEIDVSKVESEKIFVTPSIREEKLPRVKKELKKGKVESIPDGEKKGKPEPVAMETFDISDENIREFIKNHDDLDEWERADNDADEIQEFDLMKPLNFSFNPIEKSASEKQVKAAKQPKKSMKRKFPHETQPKVWKKSA